MVFLIILLKLLFYKNYIIPGTSVEIPRAKPYDVYYTQTGPTGSRDYIQGILPDMPIYNELMKPAQIFFQTGSGGFQ